MERLPSSFAVLAALASIAVLAAACDSGPPVKSASGERIDSITYEEHFPLSADSKDVTFHGDRLRRAVEMLDRQGVMAMSGSYEATGVLDKSTLVLVVSTVDHKEHKLVVKNCAEAHVCGFFAEAMKSGLVERLPVVCRDAVACTKK